ncbi:MAG: hypothetical protein RLZZ08_879 [Pseudomonadota bacterium]|jgi:phasin family protein
MADKPIVKPGVKAGKPALKAKAPVPGLSVDRPATTAPVSAVPVMAPADGPKTEPAAFQASPVEHSQATPALETPPAPEREPVPAQAEPATPKASIKDLKEKIMATQPSFDAAKVTETVTAAFSDMQAQAKVAYDKGTAAVSELTDFAKGNVEAVVASGKILAGGVQELGKSAADETKAAYEVVTADLKELAAVKSPTELFQLQGKIARRNFDAMVAAGTKNSEAVMKLAQDMFAPLSGRMHMAVEKISKVA